MIITLIILLVGILITVFVYNKGSEGAVFAVGALFLVAISISLAVEVPFMYNQYTSTCVVVRDGGQEIYRGKSKFFVTESRGNQTFFKQVEERAWFPRTVQERISSEITSGGCDE